MAQQGAGWPPGSYNPSTADLNGVESRYELDTFGASMSQASGQGPFGQNAVYQSMPNSSAVGNHGYATSSFATYANPNENGTGHGHVHGHGGQLTPGNMASYGQYTDTSTPYQEVNHQQDQTASHGHSASQTGPYGNFTHSTFAPVASGHEWYPAVGPDFQSHATVNFGSAGWQSSPNQSAPTQYGQQALPNNDTPGYPQLYYSPQSLNNAAHSGFAPAMHAQGERSHLGPQLYNNNFQAQSRATGLVAPSNAATGQITANPGMTPARVITSLSSPGMAPQISVPKATAPSTGTSSGLSKTVGLNAGAYTLKDSGTLGGRRVNNSVLGALTEPWDPISQGLRTLPGVPGLAFESPKPLRSAALAFKKLNKQFVAGFNQARTRLIPAMDRRLPCEINRDILENGIAMQSTDMDDKVKRELAAREVELDREMKLAGGKRAPKKQPKLGGVSRKSSSDGTGTIGPSDSESETGSESDSESDAEEDMDRHARLIATSGRPTDPLKAVEWDVVKMVWRDPDLEVQDDTQWTADAIHKFGQYVVEHHDRSKTLRMQYKEAAKDSSKQATLLRDFNLEGELLSQAVRTANEYAYEPVVHNMSGHLKLVVKLAVLLRDCYVSKDFDGTFPKAILLLMSRFTTLDRASLERIKLVTLRRKYIDLLDAESVGYLDHIIANVMKPLEAANTNDASAVTKSEGVEEGGKSDVVKAKAANTGSSSTNTKLVPTPKYTASDLQSAGRKNHGSGAKSQNLRQSTMPDRKGQAVTTAGVEVRKSSNVGLFKGIVPSALKRGREEDGDAPPGKKAAVEKAPAKRLREDDSDIRSGKKAALGAGGRPQPVTKAAPSGTPAATPARPKPSASLLFNRSRQATGLGAKRAVVGQKAVAAQESSITSLLAEIAKPTPIAVRPKEAETVRADETEKERTHRLRKEARRALRLRVRWKADEELTQVRLFTQDTTEHAGRARNMIRDARDNRSEGQMLKQAVQIDEDVDDGETGTSGDTADGEDGGEGRIRVWTTPSAIDFGGMDANQRSKNFDTRGGLKTFRTEQQKVMDSYEKRELLAVYATFADIPPTPKSPSQNDFTEALLAPPQQQACKLANLDGAELERRVKETVLLGWETSTQLAMDRLGSSRHTGREREVKAMRKASGKEQLEQILGALHNSALMAQTQQLAQSSGNVRSTAKMPSQPSWSSQAALATSAAPVGASQADRDNEVLRRLMSAHYWTDPDPYDPSKPKTQRRFDYSDSHVQAAADSVEAVAAPLRGLPFPPTEAPSWIKAKAEYRKQWDEGVKRDQARKEEMAKEAAVLEAAKQAAYMNQTATGASVAQRPSPNGNAAAWEQWIKQVQQMQMMQQMQQVQQGQGAHNQPSYQAALAPMQRGPASYDVYAHAMQQATLTAQAGQAAQGAQATGVPASSTSDQKIMQVLAALQPQTSAAATPGPPLHHQGPSAGQGANGYWNFQNQTGLALAVQHQAQQASLQQQHRNAGRGTGRGGTHNSRFPADAGLDYDGLTDHETRRSGAGRGGKPVNKARIGTRACVYWAQGTCHRGDQCTWRHDPPQDL